MGTSSSFSGRFKSVINCLFDSQAALDRLEARAAAKKAEAAAKDGDKK